MVHLFLIKWSMIMSVLAKVFINGKWVDTNLTNHLMLKTLKMGKNR